MKDISLKVPFWKSREQIPARPSLKVACLSGLGAMLGILGLSFTSKIMEMPLLMAPFGASCFLIFALPASPLAQPRNVIFGHFFSTMIGLLMFNIYGDNQIAMGIAVGLAVFIMLITRTGHPPAGADPIVIFLVQPGWHFLILPTLIGAIGLVLIALIFNNLRPNIRYPTYW
ncbi:HPP family protein [Curvivirga aplysinae]|uniref:HPP family protein n=1 Tax=Curvivirga aplysinae TaxID=2529852 RepID=UPI0012BB73D9|nr:HPP family protein [Curvivirga aplysinae]MTI09554.1 HPP family protein [Curvivirga aplysinae]